MNKPEITIKVVPKIVEKLSVSLKKTMPRVTPKINRVYLKGVTADTSPVRIAFIKQVYAATPNNNCSEHEAYNLNI